MPTLKPNPDPNCESCQYFIKALDRHCEVEKKLRSALRIAHLGIWEWDMVADRIALSEEAFHITGIDSNTFDGTLAYISDRVIVRAHRELFLQSIEEDLQNGGVLIRDYMIDHPAKEVCWVRLSGETLLDEAGKPYKMLGTLLDITQEQLNASALKLNSEFLESLLEALPNPIFYKDVNGLYRFCNTAFIRYLGLSKEQIIDKGVYDISPKHLADIYHRADMDLLESRGSQVYEANVKYADGSLHDVIFSKAVHMDDSSTPVGIVGIMQDITEKKAIERQVAMLHTIKDVFLEINHQIMTFDTEKELLQALLTKLQRIFPACSQSSVLELGEDEILTIVASNGFDQGDKEQFKLPLKQSFMWIDVKGCFTDAHIVNDVASYVSSGSTKVLTPESGNAIASTLIVPITINGALKWFFSLDSDHNHIYTDIDRKVADFIREELPLVFRIFELYQTTLRLSRYDALTGLMNRSYFETVFDARLASAKRNGDMLILMLFDLDGLKTVNDRHGHHAGDVYLQTFSQHLLETTRESDSFSRIGGDEFIGLFTATEEQALICKIEALRETFKAIAISAGSETFLGNFSYGYATYPSDSQDLNKLMQIADMKMYVDKIHNKAMSNTNIK